MKGRNDKEVMERERSSEKNRVKRGQEGNIGRAKAWREKES